MIEVRRSSIHGYGVFATRDIRYGEEISIPRNSRATEWSAFKGFNRSCFPNAIIQDDVFAIRSIFTGEEITLGYIIEICKCHHHA